MPFPTRRSSDLFAGELLGINAFNQPGVEEGKNATYALLGRPGYEEKKAELDARPEKKAEYMLKGKTHELAGAVR